MTRITRLLGSLKLNNGETKPAVSSSPLRDDNALKLSPPAISLNIPNIRLPLPIQIRDKPTSMYQKIIESPSNMILNEINDVLNNGKEIREPESAQQNTKKHAVRMIVIRRRKMKKHKLKKLRKRMKFEWGRLRQRREMRKEKAFQAMLLTQIREAEKFSAEKYVDEKLRQATETPIPRFWKGKRLPQFIIKEKLGIK